MKSGAATSVKRLRIIRTYVPGCRKCPHRQYYSGGAHQCVAHGQEHARVIPHNVDQDSQQPEWCPLEFAP